MQRARTRPVAEQVVVITGASSGIGRATAVAFAKRGAKVIAAARGREALAGLVTEVQTAGGQAHAVPTDVAEWKQVHALAREAVRTYGRVDTWVNNASVHVYAPAEQTTPEEFARILQVNLLGQIHGALAALPELRRCGGGALIGVSSIEGARAVPLQAAYAASQWGMRGFYDVLRMELMADKVPVGVATVLPAVIDTPLFTHSRNKLEHMAMPPPPMYAPEVVAHAIVRAAVYPRREVTAGGAGLPFILGQRLAPALTDRVMSIRRLGYASQITDRPDPGFDNLHNAAGGPGLDARRVRRAHA